MDDYYPGSLRLVRGKVLDALDEYDSPGRDGILVQEYEEIDDFRCAWRTVCPLIDAYFMTPRAPRRWTDASWKLRQRLERGEHVTIRDELEALG